MTVAPSVFDVTVIPTNLTWGDWTITTIERFTYINSRNTSPIVRVTFEKPGYEDVLARFDIGKVMFIDAPPAVPTVARKKELHDACIR